MNASVSAPGSTIGILGGGQLGRMTALAGRHLGYRFQVLTPETDSPAGAVADIALTAPFNDTAALSNFAKNVACATFEFENIPATAIEQLERETRVYPGSSVLRTCQNRLLEKNFLKNAGFPCTPFAPVDSPETLKQAINTLGVPCVLKSAQGGYDGKGQRRLSAHPTNYAQEWQSLGAESAVLEQWIDFEKECSVVCARNVYGQSIAFPVAENQHQNHILHTSIVPARLSPNLLKDAADLALAIAESLNLIGLLAVEFFITRDGKLLVNELAPRPHNSGHYSLDACLTNQFEQHVRAICGLPLGAPDLLCPVVMVNLLGDLWVHGHPPDWNLLLKDPTVKLHLYGKKTAKPGRKMGHFCLLNNKVEDALEISKKHLIYIKNSCN